jgi:hypothetical protein
MPKMPPRMKVTITLTIENAKTFASVCMSASEAIPTTVRTIPASWLIWCAMLRPMRLAPSTTTPATIDSSENAGLVRSPRTHSASSRVKNGAPEVCTKPTTPKTSM